MLNYPNYYNYPVQQFPGQNNQAASYTQNYQQAQPLQDERIWVTGEASAQAYLIAPNSFVRLWDSQSPVFYEKRADPSGRPYMETFEYKRRGSVAPSEAVLSQSGGIDYNAEIEALKRRIEALEEKKHEQTE